MALERYIEAATQFREQYPDIRLAPPNVGLLTNVLTEDGEVFLKEQVRNVIVQAANRILNQAFATLSGSRRVDDLATLFPEYRASITWGPGYISGGGTLLGMDLPSDFGWLMSARWRRNTTASGSVADVYDSAKAQDHIHAQENAEQSKAISAYVRGGNLIVARAGVDSNTNEVTMMYVRKQQHISLTGTDDLLLSSKWDEQLIRISIEIANTFKRG